MKSIDFLSRCRLQTTIVDTFSMEGATDFRIINSLSEAGRPIPGMIELSLIDQEMGSQSVPGAFHVYIIIYYV